MSNDLSPSDQRRHDLYADMAEHIADRLIKQHGMDAEQAADVGNYLADFLSDHWKGQSIYFSSDYEFRNSQRDWEIFRRFGKEKADDLAREFGLSFVRVYQINKRCQTEYRRRVQKDMFTEADPLLNSGL